MTATPNGPTTTAGSDGPRSGPRRWPRSRPAAGRRGPRPAATDGASRTGARQRRRRDGWSPRPGARRRRREPAPRCRVRIGGVPGREPGTEAERDRRLEGEEREAEAGRDEAASQHGPDDEGAGATVGPGRRDRLHARDGRARRPPEAMSIPGHRPAAVGPLARQDPTGPVVGRWQRAPESARRVRPNPPDGDPDRDPSTIARPSAAGHPRARTGRSPVLGG